MKYALRLYVSGESPHTRSATANLTALCERYLSDGYDLEILDIFENPELAEKDNILAVPTLTRLAPPPTRKIVGDLSDLEGLRKALDIGVEPESGPADPKQQRSKTGA